MSRSVIYFHFSFPILFDLIFFFRSFLKHSNQPRPYKVWSSDRQKRKSITASNLQEFKIRGAEKLGYENYRYLRVVFENDGTEVEDDSYFQSAEKDTIFLLLRDDENWLPPGMDALKSGNFFEFFFVLI